MRLDVRLPPTQRRSRSRDASIFVVGGPRQALFYGMLPAKTTALGSGKILVDQAAIWSRETARSAFDGLYRQTDVKYLSVGLAQWRNPDDPDAVSAKVRRSGIYEQIGPRGGRTGEQVDATRGKPLPPARSRGDGWKLIEPARHKK